MSRSFAFLTEKTVYVAQSIAQSTIGNTAEIWLSTPSLAQAGVSPISQTCGCWLPGAARPQPEWWNRTRENTALVGQNGTLLCLLQKIRIDTCALPHQKERPGHPVVEKDRKMKPSLAAWL
jgi:hypothetical protein